MAVPRQSHGSAVPGQLFCVCARAPLFFNELLGGSRGSRTAVVWPSRGSRVAVAWQSRGSRVAV
eukprot:1221437-Lingulodinium_polyedra.AAC.1